MAFWLMLAALAVLQLLVLREWRRWGWGMVVAAATAWMTTGAVGFVRASITGITPSHAFRDMALLYMLVVGVSLGRPILIMTDLFEPGQLTQGERRRGHVIQLLVIGAVGVWVLAET